MSRADSIAVTNPITGEILGQVEKMSTQSVKSAVDRARTVQRVWAAIGVRDRVAAIRRFGDLLWEHQDKAIDTIRAETGKTATGAYSELLGLDVTVSWVANNAERVLRRERRKAILPFIQYAHVYHKPHGVVGFITPWNYPALLAYIDVIPALAAGNAVVIKPSELTPLTALYLADLAAQAGIPSHVIEIVTGDGSTGSALVDYVDYISFTGSTEVGRLVAQKAAKRLIPYSMELGGKDAMIVLKDANLDLAAAAVFQGGIENAGQMCVSVERVYVEAPVYDEFLERVRMMAGQVTLGAGGGFDVTMGSMTNPRELERVERHVADALDKGAVLVSGGKRRPDLGPLFYEPAILANVDHTMDVMREETFGPVIPIMPVQTEHEAVVMANESPYGLSGSIFTRNLEKGEHLAQRLNTGDVSVNRTNAVVASPALPWGGQKDSGIGRRGGPEGLLRFTTPQSIVVDRQIGSKASVVLLDEQTRKLVLVLRTLRRFLPFL